MSEDEYIIRLVDLPPNVHGFVVRDGDGFNNVYINARLSCEAQRTTALHELDHIEHDDFFSDTDIHVIEG